MNDVTGDPGRFSSEDLDQLPPGWHVDDATDEDVAAEQATWEPLTQDLRRLTELTILSTVGAETARAAQEHIRAANELLAADASGASYGLRLGQGNVRNWGNAVTGLRNAAAPPIEFQGDGEGRAWADFTLGAAYEGPAGLVHGGVLSLILDHLGGYTAGSDGKPRMTGTLTVRYRRGTRLGVPLRAEGWVERYEGVKAFIGGAVTDDLSPEQGPTVEMEAVFILPRWLRNSDQAPWRRTRT